MGMAAVGVFFACSAVLLSRRLGLDHRMAAGLLWFSVLLFTAGMAIPSLSVLIKDDPTGYALAGHGCTLLGGLMLFAACAAFQPRQD